MPQNVGEPRLPEQYRCPSPIVALLQDSILKIQAIEATVVPFEIPLTNFLSAGASGLIFSYLGFVVKLELSLMSKLFEMDLNQWASTAKAGPKFYGWGVVVSTQEELRKLAKQPEGHPVPRWLRKPHEYENAKVYYSIFKRWNTDLRSYLSYGEAPERLMQISPEVMVKFNANVSALHRIGICHMDLLPKNILVKLEDGKVTRLGMIDFGNSMLRSEWFFELLEKSRKIFTDYFLANEFVHPIASALLKKFPRYSVYDDAGTLAMWLEFEPFNFDWVLSVIWTLAVSTSSKGNIELRMPRFFAFDAGWSRNGWLKVQVSKDRIVTGQLLIQAFQSLTSFRENLEPRLAAANYVVITADGSSDFIEQVKENEYTVSDVIQRFGHRWVIQLE